MPRGGELFSYDGFEKSPLQVPLLLLSTTFFIFSSSSNQDLPSCGNIGNISCPFYLKGDVQKNCDHHSVLSLELHCQDSHTIIYLTQDGNETYKYYVEDINYQNYTVRLSTDTQVNKFIPTVSVAHDFSSSNDFHGNTPLTFINCLAPATSNSPYIDNTTFSGCTSSKNTYDSTSTSDKNYCHGEYSYVIVGLLSLSEVVDGCKVRDAAWVSSQWPRLHNYNEVLIIDEADSSNIYSEVMAYGIDVSWESIFCSVCRLEYCEADYESNTYVCSKSSQKSIHNLLRHISGYIAAADYRIPPIIKFAGNF
ncbi:hypothetical protein POM88_046089 [Heracleum sosnowskyi]|uniref:Wall-associated receptor kinase galacturonan-binding domain-containing protein n=1 Tax=Heracleum sosnowskyi TaxID=360622 RepID=A0AAD8H8L8_9APIA|nr:hypothetical protein POM88_046089 [Heracleum sosnowskyi]